MHARRLIASELGTIRDRWEDLSAAPRDTGRRLALLATFTAERLVSYLGVALEDAGLGGEIHLGSYNQIMQELLRPDSLTYGFRPTTLVVWARLEELWDGRNLPLNEPADAHLVDLLAIADAAVQGAAAMGANLIMVLPAIPETLPLGAGDASSACGVHATATAAREALRQRISRAPGALAVDAEEVMRSVGVSEAYDDRMNVLAHIPYTEVYFAAMGERIAQVGALARRASRKLVVVDADNTLWGGAVGEDGFDGIKIGGGGNGQAFQEFQRFLLELRRAGALLALASKNEEVDVWNAFGRPEMILRKEHFAAWRIGWQPKHVGLAEIAEELNLGLDSIAFIDDNPAEVAQMRAAHGGVACVMMPADPCHWRREIQSAGVLDRLPPTDEDLIRSDFYQQESQRRELRQGASLADYLRSLRVRVALEQPTASDLPRLAQLVNKTNQFNMNGVRRSEAEIASLQEAGGRVWIVRARDNFGDYGIVGGIIVSVTAGEGWTLETCLLSCRALGRRVEDAMMAHVFAEARLAGVPRVVARLEETPRNLPARLFFERIGASVGILSELQPVEWPEDIEREPEGPRTSP